MTHAIGARVHGGSASAALMSFLAEIHAIFHLSTSHCPVLRDRWLDCSDIRGNKYAPFRPVIVMEEEFWQ